MARLPTPNLSSNNQVGPSPGRLLGNLLAQPVRASLLAFCGCIAFVGASLCLFPPSVADASELTLPEGEVELEDADKEQVLSFLRQVIEQKRDWVQEAIDTWQLREQEKQFDAVLSELHRELFEELDAPRLGSKNPDVVIVEFTDYNCGFCRKLAPNIARLLKDDDRVAVSIRELPVLGPTSIDTARAALFTHRVGNYEAFHFTMMKTSPPLTPERISVVLQQSDINEKKVEELAIANTIDAEINQEIERNWAIAERFGIRGTPALIIGERLIPGYISLEDIKALVEEERVRLAKN